MKKSEMTNELVEIISQPNFLSLIDEIDNLPSDKRLLFAQKAGNLDGFRNRGIKLADGTKISIHVHDKNLERGGSWSICIGTVITICYEF